MARSEGLRRSVTTVLSTVTSLAPSSGIVDGRVEGVAGLLAVAGLARRVTVLSAATSLAPSSERVGVVPDDTGVAGLEAVAGLAAVVGLLASAGALAGVVVAVVEPVGVDAGVATVAGLAGVAGLDLLLGVRFGYK